MAGRIAAEQKYMHTSPDLVLVVPSRCLVQTETTPTRGVAFQPRSSWPPFLRWSKALFAARMR